MDHRWGIVLSEDQTDQPAYTPHISIPFGEMDENHVLPSLLHQAGSTSSMLEPSELINMPGMFDTVHSSSGFIQQRADIGWPGSLLQPVVVESADHGSSQIHGFNNFGSYSTFQGVQACPNLAPCSNSHVAALNSSAPKRQNVMAVCSKSSTRKTPYRNPTQREIHILSERQRREEMNEKLCMLRSILSGLTKKDKASTITHAIKHVTELEQKVKSLRACKADKEKQCKAKNASRPPFEKRTEIPVDNNRSATTVSKQFGGDLQEDQSCKIEIQNIGTHAILKILCPWSSGFLLRTFKALDECRVDVVQCIMTKHGGNAVYFFTLELNSATPRIDKLMSTLKEASSI